MEPQILSNYFGIPVEETTISKLDDIDRKNWISFSRAIASIQQDGPGHTKRLLERTLENLSISVDPIIFEKITTDDAFEIWSLDGRFVASSKQFFMLTSWSFDDLLTRNRSDLFLRDENIQKEINASLARVVTEGIIVDKPCEPHLVYERKVGAVSVLVNMRAFAPVFRSENEGQKVAGVIAVVSFKRNEH